VSASHILLSSEASATELKKLIENGSLTFEDAAKKYSIDTGSAQNGGSIGEFSRGELVKEFEDASFAATPGEIVGPVETEYGYHLIRVDSKRMHILMLREISRTRCILAGSTITKQIALLAMLFTTQNLTFWIG